MALDYVWRRADLAAQNVEYTGGTGPQEHLQLDVDPQPLSRVVRLVAGVSAAYKQVERRSSLWVGQPANWYLRITLENSAAPIGYPKVVHESTGAMRCSAVQVVPIGATSPFPLPDVHTMWSTDPVDVNTRRSDFARGSDPEGTPGYALNFEVEGIPFLTDTGAGEPAYATYRAFLKILCEVGEP